MSRLEIANPLVWYASEARYMRELSTVVEHLSKSTLDSQPEEGGWTCARLKVADLALKRAP